MNDDWVPIQIPKNLDEMLEDMMASDQPRVGWCMLCNSPILTEEDFIFGTNTHNCEAGRIMEAEIARSEAKARSRPKC